MTGRSDVSDGAAGSVDPQRLREVLDGMGGVRTTDLGDQPTVAIPTETDDINWLVCMHSDENLAAFQRREARRMVFAALSAGVGDYLTVRDEVADDGSYRWRDSVDHEAFEMDDLVMIRDQARRQLPLAIQALQHASEAVRLDPEHRDTRVALERSMEAVVDAAGTLLVVDMEIGMREYDRRSHGE